MIDRAPFRPNAAQLEAAAEWHFRLDKWGGDIPAAEAEQFRKWLAASVANLRAFQQTQRTMTLLESPEIRAELAAQTEQARAQEEDEACVTVPSWRRWGGMAAALLVVPLAAALFWFAQLPDRGPEPLFASTSIGKHGKMTLDDGSRLSLDENTALKVTFTPASRRVELLKGQVQFAVAPDATRPFIVSVGDRSVAALGTAFNVERRGGGLSVFLLEGKVIIGTADERAIERAPSAAFRKGGTLLSPGDLIVIDGAGRATMRRHVNRDEALAWQKGWLPLHGERLGDAVLRLNRYGPPRLEIADPRIAEMRISGVFRISPRHGFLEAVSELLPVDVEWVGDEARLTCRNPTSCD